MCGILGHISKNINKESFKLLLNKLGHRGPDDSGIFFQNGNIALGQTRLSIIDLSADGHQPMISNCGNYVIIFNGEIYNYQEISTDLLKKKYQFNSSTDTEVILNGFIEYGSEIVNKLNGMFVFAIYNIKKNELFLARDRSGIKPLYYYDCGESLIFSSEIRVLKSFSNEINTESKVLCLTFGYIPEPNTIYKNIKSFPAGYYAYYKNNNLTFNKFSSYEFLPKLNDSYNSIVSNVKTLLHNSVKRHLISDAPIGTFLSGGLDSSAITAVAAQYRDELNTLSLIFDVQKYSEETYQDLVVKRYNTKHTKYLIDEKYFLDSINDFIDSIDQPTCDGMNTFLVSKAARDVGLKTVLSGLGGDEIFYGYPSFKFMGKLKAASFLPDAITDTLGRYAKLKKLKFLKYDFGLKHYLPVRGIFNADEISKILNISEIEIYSIVNNFFIENYNDFLCDSVIDEAGFCELNLYMKNQLLRDSDVFGMANSLEIRVPFLDRELVDYALRIQPKLKFDNKINKKILADAVKPLLPSELFTRKKMGFTMPFDNWIRSNIDEFGFNKELKQKFLDNKIHWSRIWLLYILGKFN
ncbi:MAG TPA: asparagine synthase (glutamine-hydrolyzing) [Victivallales bacterium]|nr:asparagine synthase (glutamine-hydrolyzing) [Victivallales bacterium]